jgi:hypothetical protein
VSLLAELNVGNPNQGRETNALTEERFWREYRLADFLMRPRVIRKEYQRPDTSSSRRSPHLVYSFYSRFWLLSGVARRRPYSQRAHAEADR